MVMQTEDRNEFRAEQAASPAGAPGPGIRSTRGNGAPPLTDDALIILPVRNLVLFPGVVLPLTVGRPQSIVAAQEAARSQRPIGVLLQRDAETAEPGPADLHQFGTVAGVLRYLTAPDGTHHVVVQGEQRFRAVDFLGGYPFLAARVERIKEPEVNTVEIEARTFQLRQRAIEALQLLPQTPQELIGAVQNIPTPGGLADIVASYKDLKPEE